MIAIDPLLGLSENSAQNSQRYLFLGFQPNLRLLVMYNYNL